MTDTIDYSRQRFTDNSTYYNYLSVEVPWGEHNWGEFVDKVDTKKLFGMNTPRYHQRLKAGELLPLTKYHFDEVVADGTMSWQIVNSKQGYSHTSTKAPIKHRLPGLPAAYDLHGISLPRDSYFVQAAAAKIYGQSWDALTFFAELGKTITMFKGFLGKLRSAARKNLFADNEWLEYRYGWRILVFDMIEINNLLSKLGEDARVRFRESSGVSLETEVSNDYTLTIGGGGTYTQTVVDHWKVGVRGTVVADISLPPFTINPITTAWELVRFSFVIDWIINVGQLLESLSFQMLAQKYYAAAGQQVILTRHVSCHSFVPTNSDWTGSVSGSSTMVGRRTIRSPTSVSIIPQISLRLDNLKIMDLVALVVQALRRR